VPEELFTPNFHPARERRLVGDDSACGLASLRALA
jgi:hypothetical protein